MFGTLNGTVAIDMQNECAISAPQRGASSSDALRLGIAAKSSIAGSGNCVEFLQGFHCFSLGQCIVVDI